MIFQYVAAPLGVCVFECSEVDVVVSPRKLSIMPRVWVEAATMGVSFCMRLAHFYLGCWSNIWRPSEF